MHILGTRFQVWPYRLHDFNEDSEAVESSAGTLCLHLPPRFENKGQNNRMFSILHISTWVTDV